MSYVSSYDANAPTPPVGTRWIWEPNKPHATEEIEIVETIWNGEEWWVRTTGKTGIHLNDLSRFWEAVGGFRQNNAS